MHEHLVTFKDIGLQEYIPTWDAMKEFTLSRTDKTQDELWFVQHPAIYTLGLNGTKEHILNPTDIPIINIDRGGQITYHAPGQLVVYCMVDLQRRGYGVKEFVIRLQKSIQNLLTEFKIPNHLVDKAPGVYVDNKKIAALGLRVKRHCTYHGLAINVDMDLEPFKNINPCGYPNLDITQMSDYKVTDSINDISEQFKPILKNCIYS